MNMNMNLNLKLNTTSFRNVAAKFGVARRPSSSLEGGRERGQQQHSSSPRDWEQEVPQQRRRRGSRSSSSSSRSRYARSYSSITLGNPNNYSNIKDRYKVGPIIGTGSYGTVRKVRRRRNTNTTRDTKNTSHSNNNNVDFACKTIRKSSLKSTNTNSNNTTTLDTVRREISILHDLEHPHIVQLVEVFEDTKYIHVVQELCRGGELYQRVVEKAESEDSFSEKDVVFLLWDILDAIRYCHDVKHVVHRDLKPENFLLKDDSDSRPFIKIIDFGLSRKDDQPTGLMGSKVGTPYYVAPELLLNDYTSKVDIWSIGIITYILLCGYPPFAGYNVHKTLELVQGATLEFGSPEWDTISAEAKEFTSQLLRRDPTCRPTANEAMQHPWLTMHGANDEDSTYVPFQNNSSNNKDDVRSSTVSSSFIGGSGDDGGATSTAIVGGGNDDSEVCYPPIKMDSEKSKRFRQFLRFSKLQKSLKRTLSVIPGFSPSELQKT